MLSERLKVENYTLVEPVTSVSSRLTHVAKHGEAEDTEPRVQSLNGPITKLDGVGRSFVHREVASNEDLKIAIVR